MEEIYNQIPCASKNVKIRNRNKKKIYWVFQILISFAFLIASPQNTFAQNPCGVNTPVFNVNLSSSISASWISPLVQRDDTCCGSQNPNNCIEFIVTLNPLSTGVIFDFYSGAVPPGALYYQINCGPPVPVGTPICLSGVGPHIVTFCKPGNNTNEYIISAVPNVTVSNTISLNNGCSGIIYSTGMEEPTITWTSIFPGPSGAYNSYLSCTAGCDTVTVTAAAGAPAYVDYLVCGVTEDGCSNTPYCDTIRVIFHPTLVTTIPGNTVLCYGNPGMTISASTTGGTTPYSYLWSNGATTQSIFVGPGTYSVTVQDTSNCPPATASITITTFSAAITANAGPDQATCNPNSSFTLSGSVTGVSTGIWSGGTGTYSPSNTSLNASYTPSASEISSGTVSLILTTTNNGPCPADADTMTISLNSFSATFNPVITNVICNGFANGTATINPIGGASPFTYSWNTFPVQTTQTAINLGPGSYSCTVTDVNGCFGSATVTITQPTLLTATQSQINPLCNGGTGTTTVNASGGVGPYSYSWLPSGGSSATSTPNPAGTYTCIITDANGCVITKTFTITQPTALLVTQSQINPLCYGTTGSGTVNASGGVTPYSYAWSPLGGSGSTSTPLLSGSYTCIVTDANGCTSTKTFTIIEPPALTATQSQINPLCNGGTGTASVLVNGGTPGYNYSWTPSGGNSSTTSAIFAGSYTCTITDANGCVITKTFLITQPSVLTATQSQVNPLCNGGMGSASVVASGGVSSYTYSWNPSGGTGATSTPIGVGNYTCTITDSNGCILTKTFSIVAPATVTASQSQINPLCFGSTGNGTVLPTGGTLPYSYAWSPSGGTNATSNQILAGSYSCTITDANGCVNTQSFIITEPPLLTSTQSQVNPLCNGGTGNASVTVSGGTSPYIYNWNPSGGTGSTSTAIPAGNYTCTITDANACVITNTFLITEPTALTATQSQVNPLCNGGTGNASVNVTGGTGPYTFAWSPSGGNAATSSLIPAGNYTCTITDANGCILTKLFTMVEPTVLSATQSQANPLCFGGTGTASVVASGGTSPYTYAWNPSGGFNATTTPIPVGNYTCTIADMNGCFITVSFTLTEPTALAATSSSTQATCGNPNGTATVFPSGGTGIYSYSWSPSGGTTSIATGLAFGSYTCTITDLNSCFITQTVLITNAVSPTAIISSYTNLLCNGGNTGSATVSCSGGTGPYSYLWSPSGGTGATASSLSANTYSVTVTDANGCSGSTSIIITQPPALVLNTSGFPTTCYGNCDGQAVVLPSGGNGNYTYQWLPGNTSAASLSNICPGVYSITVTDQNGCFATDTAIVNEPSAISIFTSSVPAYCNHASGTGTAIVSGGVGGYSYLWQPTNQTSLNATNLFPGTYSLTVIDNNGCQNMASLNVQNTLGQTGLITNVVAPLCNNTCDGGATINVVGGYAPYQYSWSTSPVQTTATVSNLCAGTYTIIISDSNSCLDTVTVQITAPPLLTMSSCMGDTICLGQNTTLTASGSGGTPSYSFSWSPSGPVVSPQTTTTYSVSMVDANGCPTAQQHVTVQVNPFLSVSISGNMAVCSNGMATLTANASGGNGGPYNYSWQPGNFTGGNIYNVQPTSSTTYTVSVTDNCTNPVGTATFTVTVPPFPIASFIIDDTSGCGNVCANFINTTPNTQSTTWSFSDGFISTAPNLNHCFEPGSFDATLIIIDNNGCSDTATIQNAITVHPNPAASFTLGPQPTTILEPNICFTDNSTGDVVTWYWNFDDPNDQTTSTIQNPCHAYSDIGTYCASLIVTNEFGCWSTEMNCLIIEPYYTIYVPNAFTPNDDGMNDVFLPVGNDVDPENYELIIYDRWGNLIFKTNSWGQGWNGIAKNGTMLAQIDTYVWKINLKDHAGQKHSLIGHVSLIK